MIRSFLSEYAINFYGNRLNKKYVVFESDDWGSIRMASREAYNYFTQKGYGVENCPFNRFDVLESKEDIEDLTEILTSVKDVNNNPAKFTLNYIVTNPDFIKIKNDDYLNYYYETTLKTYQRLGRSGIISSIKNALNNQVFEMQFHGREHLNINNWLLALQMKDDLALKAFDFEMFSLHNNVISNCRTEYLEAFGAADTQSLQDYKIIVQDGINLFKSIWGNNPSSFIAPCYIWPSQLENILFDQGIKHIQTAFVQKSPQYEGKQHFKKIRHYQGEVNKIGQLYTVRNVLFEPSTDFSRDWISTAMRQIKVAFLLRKPAIISSHRLNYVGGLDQKNKARNLIMLRNLIKMIKKKYQEVNFITSSELYSIICKNG